MKGELEEAATQDTMPQAALLEDDTNLKRLYMAIIGQAAKDARHNDTTGQEARCWLLSRDCGDLCEYIGLNFRAVRVWVNSGCPDWINRKGEKMNLKGRIEKLENQAAAPVKVTIDWGMEEDGKIEYNGERLTLEEARAKYPNEKFIVFEWDETTQAESEEK